MKILNVVVLAAMGLAMASMPVGAVPRGHHGGLILHCTPPQFFDETPGKDAKVASLQTFSLTASDNTDPETVKLWVNNQPVKPTVTQERSGIYHIEGSIPANTTGRVWLKAAADSLEECDDFKSWFVTVGN